MRDRGGGDKKLDYGGATVNTVKETQKREERERASYPVFYGHHVLHVVRKHERRGKRRDDIASKCNRHRTRLENRAKTKCASSKALTTDSRHSA